MGIAAVAFTYIIFKNRVNKVNDMAIRNILYIALVLYIIFGIVLNSYLKNVLKWEYGVPGADLSNFFDGARAIAKGVPINELKYVRKCFSLHLRNIPYLVYLYFIAIVAFMPKIFTPYISLYLVYTIQSMVAIISALNIANFVSKGARKNYISTLIMLLMCTSLLQLSSLLMRDIWIIFFISLFLNEINSQSPRKHVIFFSILFAAVLRIYSMIITVPIFIAYYLKKEKLAVLIEIIMAVLFFSARQFIINLVPNIGIAWELSFDFDIYAPFKYVFFPNIFSQTHNIQHLSTSYHAIFGGNNEWVYYLLSCWNVYIYPIAILGMYANFIKLNISKFTFWLMMMVNIALVYGFFYGGSSEPRHKMMIIIPLAFFYSRGIDRMSFFGKTLYIFLVTIGLMLMMLFIS